MQGRLRSLEKPLLLVRKSMANHQFRCPFLAAQNAAGTRTYAGPRAWPIGRELPQVALREIVRARELVTVKSVVEDFVVGS